MEAGLRALATMQLADSSVSSALVRCLGHGISFSVLNNFLFGINNFLFGTNLLSPGFVQIVRVSAVPAE